MSVSSRRSAISSGPAASEKLLGDHDELVAAEAAERVGLAYDALQPRRHRPQQLVPGGVPERVVDALEVVEVDEQGRDRRPVAARAAEHVTEPVDDQRPVRQAGERVVGGHEGELLLLAVELVVGALALGLEGLAHPHERDVEAALEHLQRSCQHVRPQLPLLRDLSQHLGRGVAPAQAALDQLVQRRVSLRSELPEDARGLAPDLARGLFAAARHPARDRDRRDFADAHEPVLDARVQELARAFDHADDPIDDLAGAGVELIAERAQGRASGGVVSRRGSRHHCERWWVRA